MNRTPCPPFRFATLFGALALAAGGSFAIAQAPPRFDFATLLERVTDLDALAAGLPRGTKHVQFSSYDRKSDLGPEDHDAWFANDDRGKYLRVDETARGLEAVLAEVEGPGYLARIWSANPAGTIRIYVDDDPTPVIEQPLRKLLAGGISLFPPPLAGERARGFNLYAPIPFARGLRVTCEKPGRMYYQVNVVRLPPGTEVVSLDRETLDASGLALFRAARDLSALARPPRAPLQVPFRVAPGKTWTMGWQPWRTKPVLRDLLFSNVKAGDLPRTLRQTLIVMEFDGTETARAPLAEFFGCGPRGGTWRGLGVGAVRTADGLTLYCRFVCPLDKSATLRLVNRSASELTGLVSWADGEAKAAHGDLRLHAVFRESPRVSTRPFRDMTVLDVRGRGHVVGVNLSIANPVPQWWGEGDEKVSVDGESFPSIFGTGTEDYFGYAWCSPTTFTHPYHAQAACDGPANLGLTTVGRAHVIDPIPFDRSIRFDLELWHWRRCTVDWATTAFYYAPANARDEDRFPADHTPHWRKPVSADPEIQGAIEAEKLAVEVDSGTVVVQRDVAVWSDRGQQWWRDPAVGGTLTITFDAPKIGRYKVLARYTLAPDYGRHKLAINGSAASFEADFYAPEIAVTPLLEIGEYDLKARGNTLTVRCVGTNPRARPRRMFGLDCLKLVPVTP